MQYLVQMKIVPEGRPESVEEGEIFFKEFIRPTLELRKKLQDDGKILAAGLISGAIGLALTPPRNRMISLRACRYGHEWKPR